MKRVIIIGLCCFITLNLFGCSKAAIEKGPVVVTDTSKDNIDLSEPLTQNDNQTDQDKQEQQTDQDKQEQQTEAEFNLEETSRDTSSNDTDFQTNKSNETFKGIVILEGMEEEVNYQTYQSKYGYKMDYDVDRFTVTSENGIDTHMAENANPDLYPYVFIQKVRLFKRSSC